MTAKHFRLLLPLVLMPLITFSQSNQPNAMTNIKPFQIKVPQAVIDDVKSRVQKTNWPNTIEGQNYGGPGINEMKEVAAKFQKFDWRKAEAKLNSLPNFITEIDGQTIHFIHLKSKKKDATPLMLIHGWPGSIVEFLDVIQPLTEGEPAFDVVVPSVPGFGFSGPTKTTGWNYNRIAGTLIQLMDKLGYSRFAVQGGDAGAILGPAMARLAPEKFIGVHVNAATFGFMPFGPIDEAISSKFTPAEKERVARIGDFMQTKFGFNVLQSHQPQLLAFALADSPVGQMAWISQLFSPEMEEQFFTNFMIYWSTGTMASSMRLYYEAAHDPSMWASMKNSGVPTGVAVYQDGDIAIRHFSEQANTIVRWKEYPVGGHYAVMSVHDVWLNDVREYFSDLKKGKLH